MSDQSVSKGDVHKIVTDKLKEHKGEVANQLADISKEYKTTSTSLIEVRLQNTKIEGKLDAIYGNGSGRKGILERLEDKQDASDKRVAALEENVSEEAKKQASFRHDIRNQFETLMLKRKEEEEERKEIAERLEAARKEEALDIKEAKKDKYAWLKWVITGLAVVLYDYIKKKYFKVA